MIGKCRLGATDCAKDTCDECIEELLNSIEEKDKTILKLQKQVAKQHVKINEQDLEITKQKRQLLGHKATIKNLNEKLYKRDECFKGEVFDKDNRKRPNK